MEVEKAPEQIVAVVDVKKLEKQVVGEIENKGEVKK